MDSELTADVNFTSRIKNFQESVNGIGELLKNAFEKDVYERLDIGDRVKYDLFLSYTLNSLFWLYLRTQGEDPAKHAVKSEIDRVRDYNTKAKQVQDRRTIMPRIDVAAAQRFIRSGLWQPNQSDNQNADINVEGAEGTGEEDNDTVPEHQ
ncbi:nuclear nucleic acid-binding protein C1D-like isoform X2 [Zootermopsis nevadensis]|uniref:Nuclear nucleic acid-binding protein C1D n=3 Tax=Zootermopsis nevadensis TaxID=136037 RepID=A0A067QT38_ZOONE|nr:nuclear nucleic acid-binding protein C1D-like isoform X2 [Zootermopsis nevadensis]XP_021932250.1 nuclear nucleic acid-binding protein C1D-like isoform X2 [Zootermopsis nevadensis]KDR12860.1 Nuclear nucleic acid-binding protein C1D [Zootermopsis nevadensis]